MLNVNSTGPQLLSISGDATVYEADTLYSALAGLSLSSEGQISIDLGSLESMDVSGVQILVAFRRQLGAARVSFHNLPSHILDTLKLGGMDYHLR
jgi:anti-anti-sigma regulatory factor